MTNARAPRASVAMGLVVMLAAACSQPTSGSASSYRGPSSGASVGQDYQQTEFSHPTAIRNIWTHLVPGVATYYGGIVSRDGVRHSHQIISIVSDVIKVIDGVATVVVWERDFTDGLLVESELFFVAQADSGAVWLLGEYPGLYERGRFTGAPDTWISGVLGTKGGIFMPANPKPGTASYSQGRAPSVQFDDRARVAAVGRRLCIRQACYHDVLVIDEWSPLAPEDGHQQKFYAAGIGTISVVPRRGGQQESLSLTRVAHLTSAELSTTRQAVLGLDRQAYQVSKAYQHTPRAHTTTG